MLNPFITTVPSSTGFLLGSFILLVIIIFICIYTFKHERILLFHILFFIVTLLPGALVAISFFSNTPLAERYLYLPSYGFCFLFGWLMTLRLRSGQVGRKIFQGLKIFILIVIILVSGIVSHDRVKIWQDQWSFWRHAALINPKNMVPVAELGNLYIFQDNCPVAIAYFDKALSLKKTVDRRSVSIVYSNMGICYLKMGYLNKAEYLYKLAINIYPNNDKSYYKLGYLFHQQAALLPNKKKHYLEMAKEAFHKAYELDKGSNIYTYWLATTYESLGEIDQAKHYYQLSLELPQLGEWGQKARQALERLEQGD